LEKDAWLSRKLVEKFAALVEKLKGTRKAMEEAKADSAGIE